MASVDLRASYNEIPYVSSAFRQKHPDSLAVRARLAGHPDPDLSCCRVLELGCGTGVNLIPMFQSVVGGFFLGLDLPECNRRVNDGRLHPPTAIIDLATALKWFERTGLLVG